MLTLNSSGFSICEIKNITGHSNERGLGGYDSRNEINMFVMSSAICKSSVVPSKGSSSNSFVQHGNRIEWNSME